MVTVKDTFISMTQLQPWLIQLPFEYGEYGIRKHSLSTGWKEKKKHKSWAAVILTHNLRIYFNYLPYLHKLLIIYDRFIHKASTSIFNLFYCKKPLLLKFPGSIANTWLSF